LALVNDDVDMESWENYKVWWLIQEGSCQGGQVSHSYHHTRTVWCWVPQFLMR